ncbi:hypothetical protein [Cryobacterium sp. Hh7]|uniref:hypothetical protein n=1 Tax=Cryobacterium sp. Hh7 TaxID=1259159 RepID=UPI00106D5F78|nr:hypothetical protein [Cryobacterium sp. Hh7]
MNTNLVSPLGDTVGHPGFRQALNHGQSRQFGRGQGGEGVFVLRRQLNTVTGHAGDDQARSARRDHSTE